MFEIINQEDDEEEEEEDEEGDSAEEDNLISDEEMESKEVPKWDSFKDPPRESDSISMADTPLFDWFIQLFKIFAYLGTFAVVLTGAVVAKSVLLLMTSQLTPGKTLTVRAGSMFLALDLPAEERYLWVWALLLSFAVPELGVVIRSARIAIFKGYVSKEGFGTEIQTDKRRVSLKSVLAVTVVMEAAHVLGLAIFVFEILPHLDVARGVMLTNCMCLVPAILNLVSSIKSNEPQKLKTVVDFVSLLLQISGLVTWPVLLGGPNYHLWLLPLSLALTSCGWWMNYVSEESPIGFIQFLARIKEFFKERHIILYRLYLSISIGKILLFFGSALLVLIMQGMDVWDFLGRIAETFSERTMMAQEIDMAKRSLTGGTLAVASIGSRIWWVIGAQVASAYICYIFGKFACRVMIQPFSFAFPCTLVVPVTLILIVTTTALRNLNQNVFDAFLPSYIFFNAPPVYDVFEFFVGEHGWVWCLWIISQVWITLHVWKPRCERLSKTETLFATPLYSGFLVDQSVLMNRRRDEAEIRGKTDKDIISPHIIACATMWHESKPEMLEMLKSLLRMDNDQCLKLSAKNNIKGLEAETDFYTFESHIFFDDAFTLKREAGNRTVINKFVRDFLKTVRKAKKDIYGAEGVRLKPPFKYSTPYGGRLEYTLPGDNKLFVHLKDKNKIRHKKRWSQVMYMYYLLGFRLMELPLPYEKIVEKAENTFLLALDGDIDFKPDAVLLLVDLMKKNKGLGAACGRIHPVGSGFMVWYQLFEYAIGHWLQKAAEHTIGCVLCSPGCFSLFRAKALMSPNVMKKYTTKAEEARHYVQYDQGEDRWLCTLLLQRGYRVEYSAASDAYTHCPETFNEFYTQRRRWIPSTFANIIDLLSDYKRTIRVNNDISVIYIGYQMLLLAGSILGPGTILLMLVGAFHTAFKIDNWTALCYNLIPIGVFILCCLFTSEKFQLSAALIISLLYGLIMMAVLVGIVMEIKDDGLLSPSSLFLFITAGEIIIAGLFHPQEIFCLFSGVIYYVTIPSMYMLLIIYAVCNLNVVSWGTREIAKETKVDSEQEKKEVEKRAQKTKLFDILEAFSTERQQREETGALELSLSNIFKCMCCTRERENPVKEQLAKIGESLNVLKNKMDDIERSIEGAEKVELSAPTGRLSLRRRESVKQPFDEDTVLIKGATNPDDDDLRDELFNPYWIEDKDLKNSKFEVLSSSEIFFWKNLIKNYLSPLEENKDKKREVKKNLKELRDKMVVTFFMLNALFVVVIFLLQVNKEQIYIPWPLEAKANITFNPVTYEIIIRKTYLRLEPVGLTFIAFFASIMVIQFGAMLFHRFETLSHLLSNTPLTILQRKKKVSLREKLEFAKKQFSKQNQEENNDNVNKMSLHKENASDYVQDKRKSRVVNLDQMYDNILRQMKEDEEREEADKMERRRSSILPWKRNSVQERELSKQTSFTNLGLQKIDEE